MQSTKHVPLKILRCEARCFFHGLSPAALFTCYLMSFQTKALKPDIAGVRFSVHTERAEPLQLHHCEASAPRCRGTSFCPTGNGAKHTQPSSLISLSATQGETKRPHGLWPLSHQNPCVPSVFEASSGLRGKDGLSGPVRALSPPAHPGAALACSRCPRRSPGNPSSRAPQMLSGNKA